jgi:hypothetical protein
LSPEWRFEAIANFADFLGGETEEKSETCPQDTTGTNWQARKQGRRELCSALKADFVFRSFSNVRSAFGFGGYEKARTTTALAAPDYSDIAFLSGDNGIWRLTEVDLCVA